ncbi:DUF4416 domain-containing protein [Planctomycetales bacterium 10988]|nr:DUF4416 domain-containing protein [Planctomycetales bacterium 10988]
MGDIGQPQPVVPIYAVFSRYPEAIAWAKQRLEDTYGTITIESKPFIFVETSYYEHSMGSNLQKLLWALPKTMRSEELVERKHQSNAWEEEYREQADHQEARPLNLDPGYVTLGKLVLASTKDHAHRIYMREGIYAEVTLHLRQGVWTSWPWTYPDYQRKEVHDFLTESRQWLRKSYRNPPPAE